MIVPNHIPKLKEIFSFLLSVDKNPSNGWYKRLAYFHKYELDPDTWLYRVKEIIARAPIAQTLDNFNLLYGEVEGGIRWNHYKTVQAFSNTLEYKQQKYNWSKEDFDEYNKSRSSTKTNFVNRHGEIEGGRMWDEYCERQAYTNSLEYFVETYGDSGKQKWLDLNIEKAKPHNVNWISKSKGISIEEATEVLSSRRTSSFVSAAEINFVNALEEALGYEIKYTHKTKQFCLWDKAERKSYFYDICCSDRKKIIEYHGDYWHANPNKYDSNFIVKQAGLTASEIWKHDENKSRVARNRGFEIYVIWENEYIANGLNDVLEFWKS